MCEQTLIFIFFYTKFHLINSSKINSSIKRILTSIERELPNQHNFKSMKKTLLALRDYLIKLFDFL